MRAATLLSFAPMLALLAGCTGDDKRAEPPLAEAGAVKVDAFDAPIAGLPADLEAKFNDGDLAFGTPMRASDGLGPLYTRSSCDSCHAEGVRGPGLVQKMSVVEGDGVTPASDQSKLPWGHTVHPLTAGGGETAVVPPADDPSIKVSTRLGPPVIGRGYIEAITDDEIERVAAEQASRDDAIHGRVNRVVYASEGITDSPFDTHRKGDTVIGRFGLKARVTALDDFTADAFQGDMGITSPLRPTEIANPDGRDDDDKPGVDVGEESVLSRAMYIRLLEIPSRHTTAEGAKLFEETLCSVCHVPSLATAADYPIEKLAGIDAPVYSDLLLHRMGAALADGLPQSPDVDGDAGSFDWRTAPLIGLRFNRTYLHDGRAKSVEQAIEMHRGDGSEANDSIDRLEALSPDDRDALIAFVKAL